MGCVEFYCLHEKMNAFLVFLELRKFVRPFTVQGDMGHGDISVILLPLQVTTHMLLYSVLAAPCGNA